MTPPTDKAAAIAAVLVRTSVYRHHSCEHCVGSGLRGRRARRGPTWPLPA